VEVNYFRNQLAPNPAQIRFWLQELRTPGLLCEVARKHADVARLTVGERPLIAEALANDPAALEKSLAAEERTEREADRAYWLPLRSEIERLRRLRRGSSTEANDP